jgi:MFS family permease
MPRLRFSQALRALSNRNYRLFFTGQGISLLGTWMQSIASNWLIYRLSGSAFILGLSGFFMLIPVFFISPFAGVLGDRWNRHRILMVVQVMAMMQALVYAVITLTGIVQVWHILLMSCILGIITAFEMPTRQAFVIQMVGDVSLLPNAIALNSSIFNGSRLVGPALAGIIVSAAGEGFCFLINSASYIAVIAAFLSMDVRYIKPSEVNRNFIHEMREGFGYAVRNVPIRDILIAAAFISFFSMTFPVLLPVFATDILGGGSNTFGLLVSSSGAGAFLATLFLAMRESVRGLGRVMNIAFYAFGLALIGFSMSKYMYLSMALLVILGFCMITILASCNTVLQTIVDESKRGRVMSFYVMAFTGFSPAGSLLSGIISSKAGAAFTLFIFGLACMAFAVIFTFRMPVVKKMINLPSAG